MGVTVDNEVDFISKIVIVGGGTAGWMTALALATKLTNVRITLIESKAIGRIGVGEATIPPFRIFNNLVGISEHEFIAHTNATFKLGIEFVDWGSKGQKYMHAFGKFGVDFDGVSFNHHWLRAMRSGFSTRDDSLNAEACAAKENKFSSIYDPSKKIPSINYAYQFDAELYAELLFKRAQLKGVDRIDGIVDKVVTRESNPDHVESITLRNGTVITGDFFVDCSGFGGLLIEKALHSGYEDWSHWLPVDSAVTIQSGVLNPIPPYTRSVASDAGWMWRIPLQHRTSNGYVYSSKFLSDQMAEQHLGAAIEGEGTSVDGFRKLKFVTGRRRRVWVGNCVAIGLSGGFLEPLESTGIHMIQASITKLLAYFPHKNISKLIVDRFNAEIASLYEDARDFVIAHYKISSRDDSDFWLYCKHMDVPESLKEKIELFSSRGEVLMGSQVVFHETNWFSVLIGQGLMPKSYHPVADLVPENVLMDRLNHIRTGVKECVNLMPPHQSYLAKSKLNE